MGNDDVRELVGTRPPLAVRTCGWCQHDMWVQLVLGGGEDYVCYRCNYTLQGTLS